jgi:hypothetical protein
MSAKDTGSESDHERERLNKITNSMLRNGKPPIEQIQSYALQPKIPYDIPMFNNFFSFLDSRLCCRATVYHQSPWSFMASATILNPATLAPACSDGRTDPFFEYSLPVLWHAS